MKRVHYTRLPSADELSKIGMAPTAEFELSEKEVSTLRRHIYAINKDKIRRYRTMRDGAVILVWRIE